jgi:hypothetical protein
MVSAMDISTFRHEVAVFQQLRAILTQKPLDRGRASLVGPDMDVADALSHAFNPKCDQDKA